MLNGENIAADVHSVLAQMRSFSRCCVKAVGWGIPAKPLGDYQYRYWWL